MANFMFNFDSPALVDAAFRLASFKSIKDIRLLSGT